jgi:chaperonin GroES
MEAVVVAVGPGAWEKGERAKIPVKEGDRIVFGKWAGDDVKIGKEEFVVLEHETIIGVLT